MTAKGSLVYTVVIIGSMGLPMKERNKVMNKTDEENLNRMWECLEKMRATKDKDARDSILNHEFYPVTLNVEDIGIADLLEGETCNAIVKAHVDMCEHNVRVWAEVEIEDDHVTLDKMGACGAQYYEVDGRYHDVDLDDHQKDLLNWACEAMFEGAN